MKPSSSRTLFIICMLLLLVFGIVMMAMPKFLGDHQEQQLHAAVDSFREQQPTQPTAALGTTATAPTAPQETAPIQPPILPELRKAMEEYNQEIYENHQDKLVNRVAYQAEVFDLESYGLTDGILGVISIPAIDVEMPLRLGASNENLALGFAQMGQTSMPIGGENTHCVIACHRNYKGAKFLRDADKLAIGDTVWVETIWETLEYQVIETKVVLPSETDTILIQPGRDLLTIFTCTPYLISTHRLLIICERVI